MDSSLFCFVERVTAFMLETQAHQDNKDFWSLFSAPWKKTEATTKQV